MMDVMDQIRAVERRHAAALNKRLAADEATARRRFSIAKRFAKSFPAFAEEVAVKLKALEDERMKGVPEQDWQTRQLVEIATERAFVDTMIDGQQRLAAASRGPGNRHTRRAAKTKRRSTP